MDEATAGGDAGVDVEASATIRTLTETYGFELEKP